MYKQQYVYKTDIQTEPQLEGETIEEKIDRILNNNEPLTDGAPTIYTERKDGVGWQYDVRTDRFDVALEGTDNISKQKIAKREEVLKGGGEEAKQKPEGAEVQSTKDGATS